ncbi:hypothetical protein Hanom_Chr12g01095791 [Helianthus anomalus]
MRPGGSRNTIGLISSGGSKIFFLGVQKFFKDFRPLAIYKNSVHNGSDRVGSCKTSKHKQTKFHSESDQIGSGRVNFNFQTIKP